MNLFILCLAREKKHVLEKIRELDALEVSYKIVCGEHVSHPNVVFQAPKGKFDAINFGVSLMPPRTDIVVFNDVDTKIHNFHKALKFFDDPAVAFVFGTEFVKEGPQTLFLRLQNFIRRIFPIVASGELMFIRSEIMAKQIYPLKPCKAEDTYILFKLLEKKYRVVFCQESYAETVRTSDPKEEEAYKRRVLTGIYQALSYSKPPLIIKLFYYTLPFTSLLLLILGKSGCYWTKGILLGLKDYLQGDRTGLWKPITSSVKQ